MYREFSSSNPKELETCKEVVHTDMSKETGVEVEDSTLICPVCGKLFGDIDLLGTHQEEHKKKSTEEIADFPEFKCDFCDFKAADTKTIEEHAANKHGAINCEKCEYIATDASVMRDHKYTHTGEIPFQCGAFIHTVRQFL